MKHFAVSVPVTGGLQLASSRIFLLFGDESFPDVTLLANGEVTNREELLDAVSGACVPDDELGDPRARDDGAAMATRFNPK